MAAGVGGHGAAVGEDDIERPQIVAGQAIDPGEHADAAAEGQTGDTDCRARPAGDGLAVRCEPAVEVDQVEAGTHRYGVGAETHRVHFGDVDDEAVGDAGPAAVAVTARPHADREFEPGDEAQAGGHVGVSLAVGDAGWL